MYRPDVARAESLQTGRELTHRKTGGQSKPERLLMGLDQLLPHEKDGSHIQSIGHKLVNYHQNNGNITGTRNWHHPVYIACTQKHRMIMLMTCSAQDLLSSATTLLCYGSTEQVWQRSRASGLLASKESTAAENLASGCKLLQQKHKWLSVYSWSIVTLLWKKSSFRYSENSPASKPTVGFVGTGICQLDKNGVWCRYKVGVQVGEGIDSIVSAGLKHGINNLTA